MLESAFYKNLLKPALEAVPAAPDGTVLRFKKRPQGAMSAGQPDLEIAWQGRLCKLELKVAPNKPTAKQWQVLRWWAESGIPCGVLTLDEKNGCTRLIVADALSGDDLFSIDGLAFRGRKALVNTSGLLRWMLGGR